jgi:hippurate hydrolase
VNGVAGLSGFHPTETASHQNWHTCAVDTLTAAGAREPWGREHDKDKFTEKKTRQIVRQQADQYLNEFLPALLELYRQLHAHPELSLQEKQTAARLAREMRALGWEVTEQVGGHGVVAVLKNGPGPVILVRTDMDALPIVEQTGLPYASRVRAQDRYGREVGVMHACGHDMHMACWVGTARVLTALRTHWSGTLVFVAQPAEEIVAGARRMLEDGLYRRFPKPSYALALHCDAHLPVGTVAYRAGLALAAADAVDIVVKGRGGHGAAPHLAVDPVVLAARIILDLQTIVSREVNPIDPVVITVGSIHGGTKHNIIPNEVRLQLTVRTTKTETRDHVLRAIERICRAAATAARAPEPNIQVHLDEYTPPTVNDPELTARCVRVFRNLLGDDHVCERPPVMGAEDFGRYAEGNTPIFLFFIGTVDPQQYTAAQKMGGAPLPGLHSDRFAPVPEPTLRTGIRCMVAAVLDLANSVASGPQKN